MPKRYPSLLSRDESPAVKGILILLVVLGRNSILMKETNLFPYLYPSMSTVFTYFYFFMEFHFMMKRKGLFFAF